MSEQVVKVIKMDTRARKMARAVLWTTTIIGFVVAGSFWLRLSFWFELPATYSPQLSILIVALLMLFFATAVYEGVYRGWRRVLAASKKSWTLLTLSVLMLAHAVFLPMFTPTKNLVTDDADASDLRVMTLNKLYDNDDYSLIANYVDTRNPDILAIEEIFFKEAEVLAKRLGYEQWHMAECDCSAYGSDLALFSKFPLTHVDLAFEDRLGGVLRGEVELSVDKTVVVYVVHIVVPYGSRAYDIREDMMIELADKVNAETNEVIMLGDFNASPYSIDIRSLNSKLDDVALSGEKAWEKCSWYGFSELLCARIDHIFVPTSAVVTNMKIGPNVGSDHRPIDVDLALD